MKAAEWIDRLKAARGWESDYRVAQELDVSHSTLSRYRNKPESTMDDELAVRVARRLDIEPEIILVDQIAERTSSDGARTALAGLLDRLTKPKKPRAGGGAAALDITSAASLTADPGQLHLQPVARKGRDPKACARGIHIVSNTPIPHWWEVLASWLQLAPQAAAYA
jgi:hypothetical protein